MTCKASISCNLHSRLLYFEPRWGLVWQYQCFLGALSNSPSDHHVEDNVQIWLVSWHHMDTTWYQLTNQICSLTATWWCEGRLENAPWYTGSGLSPSPGGCFMGVVSSQHSTHGSGASSQLGPAPRGFLDSRKAFDVREAVAGYQQGLWQRRLYCDNSAHQKYLALYVDDTFGKAIFRVVDKELPGFWIVFSRRTIDGKVLLFDTTFFLSKWMPILIRRNRSHVDIAKSIQIPRRWAYWYWILIAIHVDLSMKMLILWKIAHSVIYIPCIYWGVRYQNIYVYTIISYIYEINKCWFRIYCL